jgi:hypothetical protein
VPPPAFFFGLLGVVASSSTAFVLRRRNGAIGSEKRSQLAPAIGAALWAVTAAWIAYLLYSLGWLPGATQLQAAGMTWAAGAVTLAGGLLSLAWSARQIWRPEGHQ